MKHWKGEPAGVDEAGRGPLAGPVVAAAVILDPHHPIEGIKDSKLLTPQKREILSERIKISALGYGMGEASVEEIDAMNIFHASLLAMKRAVFQLLEKNIRPEKIFFDGTHCPPMDYSDIQREAVIQGDRLMPCISAASILAKTMRDKKMCDYDKQYPVYGFAKHKGYPTVVHKEMLKQWGPSLLHRKTFLKKIFPASLF